MTDLEILDRCIRIIDSPWATADLKAVAQRISREILEGVHPPQQTEESQGDLT